MPEYRLRLSPSKETQWEAKYKPVIHAFRYALFVMFSYYTYPSSYQCQIPTLR